MSQYQHRTFSFTQTITPEQLNFFQQYGFIHFKNFISRDEVENLTAEIEKVAQYFIQNNIQKINGIPLKFGKNEHNEPLIQRMAFTSLFSKPLSNLLKKDAFSKLTKLLGQYEGRIGEFEKDGLVVNHYLNLTTSTYKQLGWHTDSPRDIFLGSRILPMLNVGLHLDDCPIENGGLRLLAGTHHQGLWKLLFRKKYFVDNKPDKNEIGFNIEAGDLTVHDGRLWHRVQQSPFTGEKSRRRVIYIPIVTGAYRPKNSTSSTPFYHRLGRLQQSETFRILSLKSLRERLAGI